MAEAYLTIISFVTSFSHNIKHKKLHILSTAADERYEYLSIRVLIKTKIKERERNEKLLQDSSRKQGKERMK